MLNLAALTAGVDRPQRHRGGDARGSTTTTRGSSRARRSRTPPGTRRRSGPCIARALEDWDAEFLAPSAERRRALLAPGGGGEDVEVPRDVLTTLLRHGDELDLTPEVIRREVAFYLLAGAHTSATAFVRAIDHILGWLERHPEDAAAVREDPLFVQRCVHETVRLNPSSPTGRRRALAPVTLRSGVRDPRGRHRRHRPAGAQPRPRAVRAGRRRVQPEPHTAARGGAVRAELRRRACTCASARTSPQAWCPAGHRPEQPPVRARHRGGATHVPRRCAARPGRARRSATPPPRGPTGAPTRSCWGSDVSLPDQRRPRGVHELGQVRRRRARAVPVRRGGDRRAGAGRARARPTAGSSTWPATARRGPWW